MATVTCVRILLFVFNALFALFGLALVILGAVGQSGQLITGTLLCGPYVNILVVGGSIMFVISSFGCCGAWYKNRCSLIMFSILMSVVLLVVIIAFIFLLIWFSSKTATYENSKFLIEIYNANKTNGTYEAMDQHQETMQCCGISNPLDWELHEWFASNGSVPDSCCIDPQPHCGDGQLYNSTHIYTNGCLDGLNNELLYEFLLPFFLVTGVAIVVFIGIFLSSCLASEVQMASNKV